MDRPKPPRERPGDRGQTSVPAAGAVSKDHPLLHASGALDELNALLGTVRNAPGPADGRLDEILAGVQASLFTLGAELAGRKTPHGVEVDVPAMDALIEEVSGALPVLRSFILPAGSERATRLHVARAVCRRAERRIVAASEDGAVVSEQMLAWINRLSLLLFALARRANAADNVPDACWPSG